MHNASKQNLLRVVHNVRSKAIDYPPEVAITAAHYLGVVSPGLRLLRILASKEWKSCHQNFQNFGPFS